MILSKIYETNEKANERIIQLVDKLAREHRLEKEEYQYILDHITQTEATYLYEASRKETNKHYQDRIFMRGLIEFSNFCKQNCNYCGIRGANTNVDRYRLDLHAIMECCDEGYRLGYRTFVLQSGEDDHYTDEVVVEIVKSIKEKYNDVAVTLSFGERSKESYQKYFDAGADRFLLRHEAASKRLYDYLHPNNMSYENRMNCLETLKEIGFQVGAGFMVGSPTQTNEDLVEDILFIERFQPHMCGIGPYINHSETPLAGNPSGGLEETRVMLSIIRLVSPKLLLPSTTALGTIDRQGREKAMKSGANVVMPNLSPMAVREKYELYEDKICTGDEAAHCRMCIEGKINRTGFRVDMGRGDHVDKEV